MRPATTSVAWSAAFLLSIGGSVGWAQETASAELEGIIGTLNVWVTMLSLLVTVVIGFTAIGMIYHYRQADETRKSLVTDYEKRILDLEQRYQLAALRKPEEILEAARRDYEPHLREVRTLLMREIDRLESSVRKVNSELAESEERVTHVVTEVRSKVAMLIAVDAATRDGSRASEGG